MNPISPAPSGEVFIRSSGYARATQFIRDGHLNKLSELCAQLVEKYGMQATAKMLGSHGQNAPPLIHVAVLAPDAACVKFLASLGAPLGPLGEYAQSSLRLACNMCSVEVIDELAAFGVDFQDRGPRGDTLLMGATRSPQPASMRLKCAKRLVDGGSVDISAVDPNGMTALHWAATVGAPSICVFLIDAGAMVDPVDHAGRSPLQCAMAAGHVEVAAVLVDAGADPAIKDNDGMSAMDFAELMGASLPRGLLDLIVSRTKSMQLAKELRAELPRSSASKGSLRV